MYILNENRMYDQKTHVDVVCSWVLYSIEYSLDHHSVYFSFLLYKTIEDTK